ncbi:hypothetical protein IFM89_007672 [Coptis chinensis]|uniref:Uncharacterized protein n=1 Tax=Coptis chinensis TaxID=261450 RepID=A0A835HTL0_9MAGN|nr:hypothetical protein IFM89_007672 [Coptis chinensis]
MYDGDFVKQEKINEEIVAYREAAGDFGRIMAKNARASMLPEMELVGEWVLEDASPLEENLQENEIPENWSTTNEVPIVDQTYEEMGMMELLRTMEQGQQPFTSQDDADDMHCS